MNGLYMNYDARDMDLDLLAFGISGLGVHVI